MSQNTVVYCVLKFQLFFLNLSSKVLTGIRVTTSKYPYMAIFDNLCVVALFVNTIPVPI